MDNTPIVLAYSGGLDTSFCIPWIKENYGLDADYKILEEEKKKWPFNKNDRSMNVWFSSNMNYKPIRFHFNTPIGKIVGNIASTSKGS